MFSELLARQKLADEWDANEATLEMPNGSKNRSGSKIGVAQETGNSKTGGSPENPPKKLL
jgi:hypothetical protein